MADREPRYRSTPVTIQFAGVLNVLFVVLTEHVSSFSRSRSPVFGTSAIFKIAWHCVHGRGCFMEIALDRISPRVSAMSPHFPWL